MTSKVKGIPAAIVTFERELWGRVEKRQVIDVRKVWLALLPHLDGDWVVRSSAADDTETSVKRVRSIRVARISDGAEIEIYPDFNQDHEVKIRVRPATFYYSDKREYNNSMSDKWLFNAYGEGNSRGTVPCAVIDITKRNARAIAADIERRVINPTAAIMPRVHQAQAERAARERKQADAVGVAKAVKGVTVRAHYSDKSVMLVEIADRTATGTIRPGNDSVYFERLSLPVEALAEFAALMAKYAIKE